MFFQGVNRIELSTDTSKTNGQNKNVYMFGIINMINHIMRLIFFPKLKAFQRPLLNVFYTVYRMHEITSKIAAYTAKDKPQALDWRNNKK